MVKRPKGYLSKTTRKLKAKRKLTPNDFMRSFDIGQKVIIKPQPYFKSAIPHRRYRGRAALVTGKRGFCYVIEFKDGNKPKKIVAHPLHLINAPSNKDVKGDKTSK